MSKSKGDRWLAPNKQQRKEHREAGTLFIPTEAQDERIKNGLGEAGMFVLCWIDHFCHLSKDNWCHLTNAELGKYQQCGPVQVSKHVSRLRRLGYLEVVYDGRRRQMQVKWPSGKSYK